MNRESWIWRSPNKIEKIAQIAQNERKHKIKQKIEKKWKAKQRKVKSNATEYHNITWHNII